MAKQKNKDKNINLIINIKLLPDNYNKLNVIKYHFNQKTIIQEDDQKYMFRNF